MHAYIDAHTHTHTNKDACMHAYYLIYFGFIVFVEPWSVFPATHDEGVSVRTPLPDVGRPRGQHQTTDHQGVKGRIQVSIYTGLAVFYIFFTF